MPNPEDKNKEQENPKIVPTPKAPIIRPSENSENMTESTDPNKFSQETKLDD